MQAQPWPPAFAGAIATLRAIIENCHPIMDDKYATVRDNAQYALGVPLFLVDRRVNTAIVKIVGIECEATWPSYVDIPMNMDGGRLGRDDFAQRGKLRIGLWLHGGGYCLTGTNSFRHVFAFLALAADVLIIAPNFRNAPNFPFPCALQDCIDTYKVIQPDFIGGESAGGALAFSVLLKLHEEGSSFPRKIVALSPWVQLDDYDRPSWEDNTEDYLVPEACKRFAEAYSPNKDFKNPLVSPYYADWTPFAGKIDVLLDAGSKEVFRDQIMAFEQKLRKAHVHVSLHVGDNLPHVYLAFSPLLSARHYFPEPERLLHQFACFVAESKINPCSLPCHHRAEWETSASQYFCESCFKDSTWQEHVVDYGQILKDMINASPPDSPRAFERCADCHQRLCPRCFTKHKCSRWIFFLRELCCLARLQFGELPDVSADVIAIDKPSTAVANFRRLLDAMGAFYIKIITRVHQLLRCVEYHLSYGDEDLAMKYNGTSLQSLLLQHLRLLVTWGLPRLTATALSQGIDDSTSGALRGLMIHAEEILEKVEQGAPGDLQTLHSIPTIDANIKRIGQLAVR